MAGGGANTGQQGPVNPLPNYSGAMPSNTMTQPNFASDPTLQPQVPQLHPPAQMPPGQAGVPPWLQASMGAMQAGQMGRPQVQPSQMQRRPMQPMGPISGFMPQAQPPQMGQPQLTPQMLNQLLAQRSGLMGGGGGGQQY